MSQHAPSSQRTSTRRFSFLQFVKTEMYVQCHQPWSARPFWIQRPVSCSWLLTPNPGGPDCELKTVSLQRGVRCGIWSNTASQPFLFRGGWPGDGWWLCAAMGGVLWRHWTAANTCKQGWGEWLTRNPMQIALGNRCGRTSAGASPCEECLELQALLLLFVCRCSYFTDICIQCALVHIYLWPPTVPCLHSVLKGTLAVQGT